MISQNTVNKDFKLTKIENRKFFKNLGNNLLRLPIIIYNKEAELNKSSEQIFWSSEKTGRGKIR